MNCGHNCNATDGHPTIVTYAGRIKLPYINMAVLLGFSLQKYAPQYPRICIVVKDMDDRNKRLLSAAGWQLMEVSDWHAGQSLHWASGYWQDVYDKINVFRIRVGRILYLDADTIVRSDEVKELMRFHLPLGHIAMVKD